MVTGKFPIEHKLNPNGLPFDLTNWPIDQLTNWIPIGKEGESETMKPIETSCNQLKSKPNWGPIRFWYQLVSIGISNWDSIGIFNWYSIGIFNWNFVLRNTFNIYPYLSLLERTHHDTVRILWKCTNSYSQWLCSVMLNAFLRSDHVLHRVIECSLHILGR